MAGHRIWADRDRSHLWSVAIATALTSAAAAITVATGCDAGSSSAVVMDASTGAESVFACSVPAVAPSLGSCIGATAVTDGGSSNAPIACNPVTNEPCAGGAVCDATVDSAGIVNGFACFSGDNSAALCGVCSVSAGPLCGAGLTCTTAIPPASACARYCCTSMDCGDAGVCVTSDANGHSLFSAAAPNLGLCAAN
jgi:hypothetical protein